MRKRLASFFYKEISGLHEAAYLLGAFAILSQLLALVRDRLFAHIFGAGAALDVYYAAFRLPDVLYAAVASLVSVYVLIPFLEEKMHQSPERARTFLSNVFSFFIITITACSALLFVLAPYILPKFFSGFGPAELQTLVHLTRIMLLQPILLGVSNFFGSVAQVRQRFLLYAATPIVYNVGIIIGLLVLFPLCGPSGLAWGVVLGALLHLSVQVPYIRVSGMMPRFRFAIDLAMVKKVVAISLPRTLTLSAQQLSMLFLQALASLFATGSISVFTFAYNLQSVPLTIIGVSYSVAAFPTLAKYFSSGDRELFLKHITTTARHILFWSLPAMALCIVLRAHIVRVILGSGAFDWSATRLTAAGFALFVISLAAQSLILLLVRGYYAAGNTWKPLIVNVASMLVAVMSAYLFTMLFVNVSAWREFWDTLLRLDDLSGTVIIMLPLGYTCATLFNALLLFLLFERDFARVAGSLWSVVWKSGIASLAAGTAAYATLHFVDPLFPLTTSASVFIQGIAAGLIGIAMLVGTLTLFKSEELQVVFTSFKSRFWKKKKIIVPE